MGFTGVEFDETDQVLIINSESIRYLRKKKTGRQWSSITSIYGLSRKLMIL